MLRLRPYKAKDSAEIAGWFCDEKEFQKWSAGKFNYPITKEDLEKWQEENEEQKNIWSFVLTDEKNDAIGHICMKDVNFDTGEMYFGFIIINPQNRGRGYAKEMICLAVNYAKDILKMKSVTIAVFTNNPGAIKCYKALGFKESYIEENALQYKTESWDRLHMTLKL